MDERDDDRTFLELQTTAEIAWEQHRRASIRTFRVELQDGSHVGVLAHYYSNQNPGGHLNFFTITPGSRHVLSDCFQAGRFRHVHEITPLYVNSYIDSCELHAQRLGAQSPLMDNQPQKKLRVH